MYIDDCIDGTLKVFNGEHGEVFNVGSDEQVSINQMIQIIEDIAEYKVKKNYLLDKPKGVRGRSSDNTFIKNKLDWSPSTSLKNGLEKTYEWIFNDISTKNNNSKFIKY